MAVALMVAGCGGGGGGDTNATPQSVQPGTPTTPQTFYTRAQGQLPGHLSHGSASGVGRSYDLQTGITTFLPALPGAPDQTGWAFSAGGKFLIRVNAANWKTQTIADVFSAGDLSKPLRTVKLPANVIVSALSWDGQYLMAYQIADNNPGGRLAIFDTKTSEMVKIGSKMDGVLRFSMTAAWVPDGSYVYFVDNKLYGSRPTETSEALLATFDELPFNDGANQHYTTSTGGMAVSPDGNKLAFAWAEFRNFTNDTNIWVVNLSERFAGHTETGKAHRLTKVPNANDASGYIYTSPVWSPDGKYIAGVAKVEGTNIVPEFPGAEDTPLGGWSIAKVSGCLSSVFALPSGDHDVPVPELPIDKDITLKVRTDDGTQARWLTVCGAPVISWTP